jgi:hypothetical protein
MQAISVYLYPNKVDVFTNALAAWQPERYRRVYNRNLKIYRSVDNRIDIQVRNSDQKSADTSGSSLIFNLINRDTKDLVVSKDCEVVSYGTGKWYVILSEVELHDISNGFYNYSVTQESRNTIDSTNGSHTVSARTPMYIDSQYEVLGTLELVGDALGDAARSLEVTEFQYINPATTGYQDPSYYISSIIDTNRGLASAQSLHTFQFYHDTNFTGKITIEGSLDKTSSPKNWVTVPNASISGGTNQFTTSGATTTYRNVVGKYNWFRIKFGATFNGSANFTIGQTFSGLYDVSIYAGGAGYNVGDVLIITGDKLGGYSGVNDLTITVASVNYNGAITAVTRSGTSAPNDRTYVLGATGIPATGTVDKVLYR